MTLEETHVQTAPQTIQQQFWLWAQALPLNLPRCFHMQLKLQPTLVLTQHFSKHQDFGEPADSTVPPSGIL